jgi:hypothetical protein
MFNNKASETRLRFVGLVLLFKSKYTIPLIANLNRRTPTAKYLGLTGIPFTYLISNLCPRILENIRGLAIDAPNKLIAAYY